MAAEEGAEEVDDEITACRCRLLWPDCICIVASGDTVDAVDDDDATDVDDVIDAGAIVLCGRAADDDDEDETAIIDAGRGSMAPGTSDRRAIRCQHDRERNVASGRRALTRGRSGEGGGGGQVECDRARSADPTRRQSNPSPFVQTSRKPCD
jgi:hypothetical protein